MSAREGVARPVTILVCALGGEGGGVLSEWLVAAARSAGFPVQSTSIPGVAQRTGATTYYLEIVPTSQATLGGRTPVLSLHPVPGALDLLVSSELLETARQVASGMVWPDRTLVVTSSARTLTTAERMPLGDGRRAAEPLLDAISRNSRAHVVLDMAQVARETGTVVSAVMFGAVVGSGAVSLPRTTCEAVIRAGGHGAEASLRGFAQAYEIVERARSRAHTVEQPLPGDASRVAGGDACHAKPPAASADAAWRGLPDSIREVVALGSARVAEYQDRAYAALYRERVERVLAAERSADPDGVNGWQTTGETARYLALWMAFDDIVRVADLKCRATRRARVGREVKVGEGELLRVWDHFKPGVPEFAALLPPTLANALTRWDRRRQTGGRAPFALPLKIGTHTVLGMLSLRLLAGLRWLRPHGARYAEEQTLIERWLTAVVDGSRAGWAVGHELALCGRLIKGYGSTNARGRDNLLHIVDHLAIGAASPSTRADAIRAARSAALADEGGHALDRVLIEHGAAPRPVAEAPLRFVRKPHRASARARGEEQVSP